MGLIFYGSGKKIIDVDEFLTKCPACETDQWANVAVNSVFYHIYWIPVFAYQKETNIVCRKCGLKRYGLPASEQYLKGWEEKKHEYRHPWYHYIGALFFIAIIVGIVASIIK